MHNPEIYIVRPVRVLFSEQIHRYKLRYFFKTIASPDKVQNACQEKIKIKKGLHK